MFCALCSSRLLLSALPSAGLQSLVWPFSPWAFGRRAHVSKYHRTRLTGSCLSPPQRSCKALKKKSTFFPSCLKIQQFKKKEKHCFLLFNSPFTSCPPCCLSHLRVLESITLSQLWGKLRHRSIKLVQCPADVKPKPASLGPESSELCSCC